MAQFDPNELEVRLQRLERKNRFLTAVCGLCLSIPFLALVGWQSASDTLRVKRVEIIDDRGVPLVILGASRNNEGGSIVLRDKQGERRAWWEVAPEYGTFTMNSAKATGEADTTLGLQVGKKNARMAIISESGAMVSTSMEGDDPTVEMYNKNGNTLFVAPIRPGGRGD
jgi:hypothetical protein